MDCVPVTWPVWVATAAFFCACYIAWRTHILFTQLAGIFEAIEESIDEEEARARE